MEKNKYRLLLLFLQQPKFKGIEAQVNLCFLGESFTNPEITFPLYSRYGRVSLNIACDLTVPSLPTETSDTQNGY
jgi:hypothetical protein